MDFGGYTSLRGFFGSAEKKAQRVQDLQYAQNLMTAQQNDAIREMQYRTSQQNLINEADALAQEVLLGKGVRPKDREDIQNYASELMTPINDMIKKYGSYERALANGLDRLVADYRYKITNNDTLARLKLNQNNFKQLILAKNDAKTADRIFPSDIENLKKFEAGETDYITYKGVMNNMDNSFIDSLPVNQQITPEMYFDANKMSVMENFTRDTGINAEDVPETYLISWMNNTYGFDERLPQYGKKEIKTTPGMLVANNLKGAPVISDPTQDYKKLFESSSSGADIAMDSSFGYDYDTPPPTKNGITLNASGRVFANTPNLEMLILSHVNQGKQGNLERKRNGSIEINNKEAKGLFNFRGDEIKDNDIGFFDVESSEYDLEFNGMFIAQKVTGNNIDTGEKETFLLTKTGDKSKIEEIKKNYTGISFTSTYVAAYTESDIIFDDVYYEEIKMTDSLLAALSSDEKVNKAYTTVKNQMAVNQQLEAKEAVRQESYIKTKQELANLYAGGVNGGADKLYNAYGQQLNYGLVSIGIDQKMLPLVLAELMETVNPDDKTASDSLRKSINSFPVIATAPQFQRYYEILKSGNVNEFFKYLQEKKPKSADKIKQRAKLWGKYINRK